MPGYVLQVCLGAFEAQFDMPCVHLLLGMMQEDGNLTLEPTQIGQPWHFYPSCMANNHPRHDYSMKDPTTAKAKG
jgi:hypothetical protein